MNVFCTNTFSIENALCLCFTLLYAILLQLLQLALKPSLLEKPVNPFLSVISSSRSDFATRPFHFHKVRIIQVDFLYVSAILSKVKTPSYSLCCFFYGVIYIKVALYSTLELIAASQGLLGLFLCILVFLITEEAKILYTYHTYAMEWGQPHYQYKF